MSLWISAQIERLRYWGPVLLRLFTTVSENRTWLLGSCHYGVSIREGLRFIQEWWRKEIFIPSVELWRPCTTGDTFCAQPAGVGSCKTNGSEWRRHVFSFIIGPSPLFIDQLIRISNSWLFYVLTFFCQFWKCHKGSKRQQLSRTGKKN